VKTSLEDYSKHPVLNCDKSCLLQSLEIRNLELQPFPCCSCGKCTCNVNGKIADLQHRDSVMQLLMGLNESFSQARGQVLLMDLLPPLQKVYSLLIQEERQRSIGQSHGPFVESTALATKAVNSGAATGTKNYKKGKERPTCSHCALIGHTVNKCYKIHGYPLGYKAKSRNPVANQVSCVDFGPNQIGSSNQFRLQSQQLVSQPLFNCTIGNQPVSQPQFTSTVGTQPQFGSTTHSPFTPEQYQKILAMIGGQEVASTPIGMANNVSFPLQQPTPLTGNHFMPRSVFDLKHSIFAAKIVNKTAFGHKTWVIDTGASDHIVCSVTLMHSFTSISQCFVELRNGESTQVTHVSSAHVSTNLTLHHVPCVPSFSFNLLSVNKLTQKLPYCLVFLPHFCFIQDLIHWWKIGKGGVSNGLYLLQNITSASAVSPSSLQDYISQFRSTHSATISAQVSVQDMSSLWHFRLGHPSFKRLLP